MPALTGPLLAAAALLVVAGAQKVVDPAMTVGALRALRLPSAPLLVRAGAAAELVLGVVAITAGGAVAWGLVAASYLAFAAFVVAALRRGTMVGSCGCFGREDTPPHPVHVALDLGLAAIAGAAAVLGTGAPVDAVAARPGIGLVIVGLAAVALYLLHAAFVDLPRALVGPDDRRRAPVTRGAAAGSGAIRARSGHHGGMAATHEVTNQPPRLEGYDVFGSDAALVEAVEREGAAWASDDLHALGRLAGSPEAIAWGFEANRHPPELRTHDGFGHRVDEVAYHPAYHELMQVAVGHGLHGAPWAVDQPGAHVARAAGFVAWSQVEAGHGCPISMTYSIVPALRNQPDLAAEWEPRLVARAYDPRNMPAREKPGAIAGMGMTEKQGGSDVRANTTRAEPAGDGTWLLTGHKWFCSAPMSDVFLMLAQAPDGLSCFLVPRWLPDGERNAGFRLQRLKDKLGNRSNASSEIELDGAVAWLVGEEGRGVRTIIDMVAHTRLDCVLGATSTIRQATAQALHHAAHRAAFGKALVDQPLMRVVLADLAVESEAATVTAMRLARAFDDAARGDEAAEAFRRLATAVGKYWVCKRQPTVVGEALECLGGNGYVEESIMPRLFRESPLNGIWEGSGNVICLDVLRALAREPQAIEVFLGELDATAGADPRLDAAVGRVRAELGDIVGIEARARRVVEAMALAFQGSLFVRYGHPAVADAFLASRLAGDEGLALGTLPTGVDEGTIIERARPKVA